jgi:dipeptidyl aminopeptidase/acylaminoacyl peptidase
MKSKLLLPLLCAALALCFLPVESLAQTPPPSHTASVFDSMPKAKRVQEVAVSPDGTQVAYIVDGELAIAPVSVGAGHKISIDGKLALREVSWSSDSKQIVFLADLESDAPAAQVWTSTADGTAPTKRAELKGNVDAPRFSPDGSKLAVLFTEGMPRVAGPLQPMTPLAGVIGSQIYEQRLSTIDLATNTLTQITPADVYVYEYEWMPDGQGWIATAAHGSGDANWYVARLYHADAASKQMHEIYTPKLQIAEPHISPDGKQVAFIEGLMSDESVTGGEVYVLPLAGGATPQNVTPNIKASPSQVAWAGNGQLIIAENIDGKSGFATVSSNGGSLRQVWSGEEFLGTMPSPSASFSRDGTVTAVARQSASAPPEVWAGAIGKWRQVSTLNSGTKPAWGEIRNFHWRNGEHRIEGWLMLPKDYEPGKSYPLIVDVHGGPSSACVSRWDTRVAGPQSAMGYFALCPNPRGSYGQGEAFTQGNVKDFGGGDYRDIMAGVDAVSKEFPIDPKRIGIWGHSYGGYMTMWAETQTNRFAAAVAGAGLSDWLSYYGVNDIDEWMIPFFGASIYDDPAVYAKSDPMHFVKAVRTPTLILVGDRDGEVPMEQSVEWWHALNAMKVPTQLVVYANEGHMFIKPADSRDYFVRTLGWFDDWFAKAAK